MELSYWEYKTWLSNIDFTVVGSGIVGLNCAIYLKNKYPKAKVLILEKGILPQGASTKNAGFACFGSISEILSDLDNHSEEEVYNLVQQRWEGIQYLRKTFGDQALDFKQLGGGHELFLKTKNELYQKCTAQLEHINNLLNPIFKSNPFKETTNSFGFDGIQPNYISHQFEGQIDTGKMMSQLVKLAYSKGIYILNNVEVSAFETTTSNVKVKTAVFEFETNKLLVATNGFAAQLLNKEVKPARAQVILTEPIKNLKIKGTFHLDEGYYYFRNIDDRILFGGGRNLDLKIEETYEFGETERIQNQLENYLKNMIIPHEKDIKIAQRWSGIMGVGQQKSPIIEQLNDHVFCGVRLGGMGVAIGSFVGKELAELV